MTPPLVAFHKDGMHRLLPARYSESGTVLEEIADDPAMLEDIVLLDGATNDRLQGEQRGTGGITPYELIYGVPNAQIVNAAFTHTDEFGSRFNDHTRGAWYAADQLATSVAEVSYHKARHLAEVVDPETPERRPEQEVAVYDDWLADFKADFHHLTPTEDFRDYLQPEPVPACYAASQELAGRLLKRKSNGVLYPSVRRAQRLCLACFRPALVYRPRRGQRLEITFQSSGNGYKHRTHIVS